VTSSDFPRYDRNLNTGGVFGEAMLERVAAKRTAGGSGEQRIVGFSRAFARPGVEDGDGLLGQRRDPLFAALPEAVDVSAGPEPDVAAGEARQLGDA